MKYVLMLFITIALSSCGEKAGVNKSSTEAGESWITAEDLAYAQGMMWYKLRISGADKDSVLGLYIDTFENKDKTGGSNGWVNGDLVKVFVWEVDGIIHSSILKKDHQLRSLTEKPFETDISTHLKPIGSEIQIGEYFYKASSESVSMNQEIRKSEIGYCFRWN